MRPVSRAVGWWVVLVAQVGAAASACCAAEADSVWRADFAQAHAEAVRLDRPLLVHFYATYCIPCRQMEKDVLKSPEVTRIIEGGYVAVMVDVVKRPDLQARYKVEYLPTDVIVAPNGQVLNFVGSSQKKDQYVANITRVETAFSSKKQTQVAKAAPVISPAKPADIPSTAPAITPAVSSPASTQVGSNQKLPPLPMDAFPPEVAKSSTIPDVPPALPVDDEQAIELALDGYCPVTLFMTRAWKLGQKEFSHEHQGQVYYFSGEKALGEFQANPAKYAPKLLGCDPVVLSESNRAVPGTTRFGAYYESELFLFESAATRSRFRANPVPYTRTKHVLKPDEVERRR